MANPLSLHDAVMVNKWGFGRHREVNNWL